MEEVRNRKLSKGFGIYERGIEQIMFSHIKLLYLKKSFKKLFRHVVWPGYWKSP